MLIKNIHLLNILMKNTHYFFMLCVHKTMKSSIFLLTILHLITNQSSDNTYSINSDFQSDDEKIIISCNFEKKKIESSTDFEKEDAIMSSIVRILKRKSKIDVDLLRDEVYNSLSTFFECNNSMFSRCLMKVSSFWKDEKVDGKRFIIYDY